MDLKQLKLNSTLVRSNQTYNIFDYKELENLMLSMTELHGGMNTSGHTHKDADEVYIFIKGSGTMLIDEESFDCKEGDVFPIPRGSFHKVYNTGTEDLNFLCVFEKYGDRK